jgi:hypothetical protein
VNLSTSLGKPLAVLVDVTISFLAPPKELSCRAKDRSGSFSSKLRNIGLALDALAGEIPATNSEPVAANKDITLSALIEMDLLKVIFGPSCSLSN